MKFASSTFILFLAISSSQPIHSQSKLGLHIGRSYSKFQVYNEGVAKFYDFSPDFDHKGFLINASFSYPLGRYFRLNPSLGYVKRGAIVTRDYGIVGYNKFSLNYIELSMMTNIALSKFFMINAGVSNNFLLNAIEYWGIDRSVKSTEFYNKFDFGLKGGLTFCVKNISLSANYFYSLKEARSISLFIPVPGNPVNEKNGYHNRSFEFSLGYQLDLKKKEKGRQDK